LGFWLFGLCRSPVSVSRLLLPAQDGAGPGRLALLRRRVRPSGLKAARGAHLRPPRPHSRGKGDRC